MNSDINLLTDRIQQFHEDEDGMEAIQVVMIVAIAAIVLIFLKAVVWPRVSEWVMRKVEELTS